MKFKQTRSYLAIKYGVCRQTISKLLAERCGITHSSHLTPKDLDTFIRKVGTPEQFKAIQKALGD
jgi:hypothetical protein